MLEKKFKILEVILVLLAILLSVFWFFNPAGNYEPALALIGFIFTASEIYRRKIVKNIESATDELVDPTWQIDFAVSNTIQSSKQDEDTHSEQSTGISIEDILAGLDSKKYTGIQISQFVKRNSGVEVVWRVRVHNIKVAFEHDPNSALYLVFSPESQDDDSFPEIVVAVFDRSSEGDLAAVSSGDIAVVRGEIAFSELAGKYSLSLKNSKLVRFYKNA